MIVNKDLEFKSYGQILLLLNERINKTLFQSIIKVLELEIKKSQNV